MLFNNRDLGILVAGAIGAVLALLLPIPLWGSMAVGVCVLVAGMLFALLRVGPDKVTLEKWLKRRLRFTFKPRRYVYHHDRPATPQVPEQQSAPESEPQPEPATPLVLDLEDVGVELLATVAMGVFGIYTVVWLQQGGAEELAHFLGY